MTKKWTVDEDDELRLFYGDENFNGNAYPCNDITFMKMIADKLNKLEEENKHLREIMSFMPNDNAQDILNVLNLQESDKWKFQKENEQLKQEIKNLQINVLDSIHKADTIQCNCSPCVVEEYVKKVVK